MLIKNAVNLTLDMNAHSDEELRAKLLELVTQFDLYGVRSFVDSNLGIVEVERRNITPEQYRTEVHAMAESLRSKREEAPTHQQGEGEA